MQIGVDFDNTIVCYDQIFWEAARERGLVDTAVAKSKQDVRDALRHSGNEAAWTELQGYVYGVKLAEAQAFPGAIELMTRLSSAGILISIISHKTRTPYAGPEYDLHCAARNWLEKHIPNQDIIDSATFHETKDGKLSRISEVGCAYFVDDLPEFLLESKFPQNVERILFDPEDANPDHPNYRRARSWAAIRDLLDVDDA